MDVKLCRVAFSLLSRQAAPSTPSVSAQSPGLVRRCQLKRRARQTIGPRTSAVCGRHTVLDCRSSGAGMQRDPRLWN